jgi:BirA family transcriptional regulator, biotin operon repressor / biotin---[acetyl-CoA-carboxylase] ligase
MSHIIGQKILHYERVTSTNDLARQRAEEGEPEGLVISAEEQTAGRGRMGRSWLAPPRTCIQLSILLRPPLPAFEAPVIMQLAALAVTSALRELVESSGPPPLPAVNLKWPNDVLLNSKKCAGILVETGVEGEMLTFAILGIGINVNHSMRDYPEFAAFATTLADELGRAVDRDGLQKALLTKLDDYYSRLLEGKAGHLAIFEQWRSQLETIGHTVRVGTSSGIEEGIAIDVDVDGALLLRRREDLIRIYSDEVTVLKGPAQRSLE